MSPEPGTSGDGDRGGPSGSTPGIGAHRSRRGLWIAIGAAIVLVLAGGLVGLHYITPASSTAAGAAIPVVAAENFWGSLLTQMGGSDVQVHTIVSDPNADPHDYESTTADAVAIAGARLVVENGAGYDDWCQKIITSSNTQGQVVLNVADLLGKVAGDNPHFWYGAAYVNATLAAMYSDLVAVAPADAGYFSTQYAQLNASLNLDVWGLEAQIRAQYAGVEVASTESIFVYMANSTGLDLVSPPEFMNAVADGDDPPTSSVTTFENQLESGMVPLLVYNAQTITPLTDQMKAIAIDNNVSVVAVTETLVPPDATFQIWMEGELFAIETALGVAAAGSS